MALIERMQLLQHERTFTDNGIIEHVKYSHVIERDGEVIQSIPHRIVIDRSRPDTSNPMPDGTAKLTSDIAAEVDA